MSTSYKQDEIKLLKLLGGRIKEQRIKKGLSQEKLSFISNLDRTYIGSVERGERNISIINLNKIALGMNISIAVLLNFDNGQGI